MQQATDVMLANSLCCRASLAGAGDEIRSTETARVRDAARQRGGYGTAQSRVC